MENKDLEGADKSLSRMEDKAHGHLYDAAAQYNVLQEEETKTLILVDFYEKIVNMWKNQPAGGQDARLCEVEKLDPRWQEYEMKSEGGLRCMVGP